MITPKTPATHGIAELEPGGRIHYVVAGDGPRTIVLHGSPETWRKFRHVIGPLVFGGWRVIAPDYRVQAGQQNRTSATTKRTMAEDTFGLNSEAEAEDWIGMWFIEKVRRAWQRGKRQRTRHLRVG